MPQIDVGEIHVRKVDSYQGEERPVYFLDLTISDRTGFVSEAQRLNVSLSRGRYGGYIIGNIEAIEAAVQREKKHENKWLSKVISHCKQNRRVVRVSAEAPIFGENLGPANPEIAAADISGTRAGYLTDGIMSGDSIIPDTATQNWAGDATNDSEMKDAEAKQDWGSGNIINDSETNNTEATEDWGSGTALGSNLWG